MITITFSLDDLFNMVWQRTVYMAENIDGNTVRSDVTPINENNRDIFNTLLKQAANIVWERIAKYATEDSSVIEPFVLNFSTDGSEDEYPNQLVYILDELNSYSAGAHNPMITNSIQDAIVSYIIYRWMLMKGLGGDGGTQAEFQSYNDNLLRTVRGIEYGNRPKIKHRTF